MALKRIASLLSCTGATGISITGAVQLVRKVFVARKVPISLSTRRHSSLSVGCLSPGLVAEPASLPRCLDSMARGRLHNKL